MGCCSSWAARRWGVGRRGWAGVWRRVQTGRTVDGRVPVTCVSNLSLLDEDRRRGRRGGGGDTGSIIIDVSYAARTTLSKWPGQYVHCAFHVSTSRHGCAPAPQHSSYSRQDAPPSARHECVPTPWHSFQFCTELRHRATPQTMHVSYVSPSTCCTAPMMRSAHCNANLVNGEPAAHAVTHHAPCAHIAVPGRCWSACRCPWAARTRPTR